MPTIKSPPLPLLMTVRQAAEYIGIGRTKMHELIQAKKVRCHMLGDRIKVSTEALIAFVASLPDEYVRGIPVKDGAPMKPPKVAKRKLKPRRR